MIDIKVFFKDENNKKHNLTTGFNGTIKEAEEYYLNKMFNLGNSNQDLMAKGIKIEVIK